MTKVILISHFELPYHKIGSWTTLYQNYLEDGNHKIDYIICSKPKELFENVIYSFSDYSLRDRIERKVNRKSYSNYLKALGGIIDPQEKYVIQLVDNFGLVKALQAYLLNQGLRKNCFIQFFYHGFDPFLSNLQSRSFFNSIDEMIVLTRDSYRKHRDFYTILPCKFSILPNGVDTEKFSLINKKEKEFLKQRFHIENKIIFLWCSKNRPKKGLNFLLDIWRKNYINNENVVLLVIGTEKKESIKNISFLGEIPNDQIYEFYQMANVYLFTSLCKEGFGMTLIEALHCGCFCIASKLGGIPEVLEYGKFGKMIENPHLEEEWINAIDEYLRNPENNLNVNRQLYTAEGWKGNMNKLIDEAKRSLYY